MQNIKEKAADDQDFLWSYTDIRTAVPSKAYLENYDRIFKKNSTNDRGITEIDANASGD